MVRDNNRLLKIVSIISLISIVIVLIILIKNPPATGYEISVYAHIPLMVWVFLIVSIAGGVTIIIFQVFSEKRNKLWLIGFFILILDNFIVLSMHAFRGYFQYAGNDHMAHLEMTKSLIETGHFKSDNLYPIIHIFVTEISKICNLSPEIVIKYLPAFLSILFLMLFMYLLAKFSLFKREQILLVCAASLILPFNSLHVQIYPHTFSVLLFPLILYLYFRRSKKPIWQFRFLLIIFLILLPYSHPSGLVAMIFLLIAMELAKVAYDKIYDSKCSLSKIAIVPILISSIIFLMWISSFWIFGAKLSSLWSSIFEPYKNPHFTITLGTTARLEWIEVVEYTLKMYGDNLIYIALSLIAGMLIIKRILNKEKNTKSLFLLLIFFLVCILIEFILFIGIGSVTVGRTLNLLYMMTIAPILVGFVLYELFKNRKRILAIMLMVIILTLISGISILSVYHSSWIFSPSWQITNMDVKGSNWFLEQRNPTLEFDAMGIDSSLALGKIGLVPEHFNYSFHETLCESLPEDSYALINKRCKLANADPVIAKARLNMRSGWGFNESDFKKLNHDQSANKLYSNGEFWIYFVESR